MKSSLIAIAAAAGTACAQATAYAQCGGQGWTGATTCVSGWSCKFQNDWYSQCLEGSSTLATSIVKATSTKAVASSYKATSTEATSTKATSTKATSTVASSTKAASTPATSSAKTSTSAVKTSSAAASSSAASTSGKVQFAGINISGFDFGCGTDGTCETSSVDPPGTAGAGQINHFVKDDGLNAFRLPVGWQYLVNNNLGGTLDATNLAAYDSLVQSCLSSGAGMCIIDIHNYARWNGDIIGQGGPTNAQFTSLWSQLATKYASESKIAFGIMNEPHDLDDITTWAATVQAAVTAIRNAGATSQKILLPGTNYSSASQFISNGSGAALMGVTNIDGTTTDLIFDVHQYLDSDDSGTAATCTTNNVAAFTTLASYLRTNDRMAFLSETGGGSTDSTCLTNVCEELSYLNENNDVFLGWTGWAAGSFATSYVLSETPDVSGSTYTDQPLVSQCIAGLFK